MLRLTVCFLLLYGLACQGESPSAPLKQLGQQVTLPVAEVTDVSDPKRVERTDILQRLQQKIKQKEDLYVHLLVPLCDNDHQGIVPVNARLGDGSNLRTNLYWGAAYGVKTFLKKAKDWELIKSIPDPNSSVLERCIFKKSLATGRSVYLIADAYRGDQMKACVEDFLFSLAGKKKETQEDFQLYSQADLLLFNGHNGLMDVQMDYVANQDGKAREAGVIGCISYDYFAPFFEHTHTYPLLTTNGLMAPEAYVLKNVVNQWTQGKSAQDIHEAAGKGYHQFQKCGQKAAYRLFHHGWK